MGLEGNQGEGEGFCLKYLDLSHIIQSLCTSISLFVKEILLPGSPLHNLARAHKLAVSSTLSTPHPTRYQG